MSSEEIRLFTLREAERTRTEVEPALIEAVEARRKMAEFETGLQEISERIARTGGMAVPYEKAARLRHEFTRFEDILREAIERIEEKGCLLKDIDLGLIDFPARLNNEDVYFCWKLGEDHIRFYHRRDEGFAGRKPIDPRDAPSGEVIQ